MDKFMVSSGVVFTLLILLAIKVHWGFWIVLELVAMIVLVVRC